MINDSISTDLGIILDKLQGLLCDTESGRLFNFLEDALHRVRNAMYEAIEEDIGNVENQEIEMKQKTTLDPVNYWEDPRDNSPEGYHYERVVTPWQLRDGSCIAIWHSGDEGEIDVKGCYLMPRDADKDGTCYLFRPNKP